jgi:hypothetical protein
MMRPGRAGPLRASAGPGTEGVLVEMAVGLLLILVSVLLIAFIIRTVQANMPQA